MNSEIIDRLRDPSLAVKLWGYDREQVDALLAELEAVARKGPPEGSGSGLAGVGEKVEAILAAAAEAAEHVRAQAAERAASLNRESREAAEALRAEADEYAKRVRSEADLVAEEQRRETDAKAEEAIAAAEDEAEQIVRDAIVERRRIEDSINDLRERRELVVQSIERLRGSLGSMVGEAELGTTELAAADTGPGQREEGPDLYDAELAGEGGEPREVDPDLAEEEAFELEGDGGPDRLPG